MKRLAPAIVLAAVAFANAASAQEKTSSDHFKEGQRLIAAGSYAEACPQFERALALTPGAGTKFNLGDCYEKTGKLASALQLFAEVADMTRQTGQLDRSEVAKGRHDALAPRVPTLRISAPWATKGSQVTLTLDTRALPLTDLDHPIRVDLGRHEAVARLPSGSESRAEVTVTTEGESKIITLEEPRATGAAASEALAPKRDGSSVLPAQRVGALIVAGVGVVAVGTGAVVAFSAKSTYEDATSACGVRCPPAQATEANDARTTANIGGVVGAAGLVLIAGGAVLWLTAPTSVEARVAGKRPAIALAPAFGARSAGLSAWGTF